MGSHKRNVVVVITMGAYIHEVLVSYGCLLSCIQTIYESEALTLTVAKKIYLHNICSPTIIVLMTVPC